MVVTFGKKFSSAVAVACVWVGGSTLAQIFYLALGRGLGIAPKPGEAGGDSMCAWFTVGAPLVVAIGGTGAVWILRWASGWPRLPLPTLFVRGIGLAVFALALMPLRMPAIVHLAAGFLGIAAALSLTWREASRGSLGTHLFPGSTRPVGEEEKAEAGRGEEESRGDISAEAGTEPLTPRGEGSQEPGPD